MKNFREKMNRRSFLKQSTALTAIAGLGGIEIAKGASAPNTSGDRKLLSQPRPMIPPAPAILLSVNGETEDAPEISVVWTFVININPAQVAISVHETHFVLALLKKHGQFVLNVPVASMVDAFDRADMNSRKGGDKFAVTGLTRGQANKVDAPTIEESPIHVECEIFNTIPAPPDRTLFLANVAATAVLPHVCDENERLQVANVPFFGMTAGSGEFYMMGKRVGHIGQSVGKDDIKY